MAVIGIVLPWGANAAKFSPPSSYVLDLQTNAVRTAARAELVRPIASLTKLMTVMVLLDAGVDLEKTVAYDPKAHYAYRNWMNFYKGDRLSGRDLLLATLIGSQNITARMLVSLSPFNEKEFVGRMNTKAQTLGLAQTKFVDVHGLSPKNISTAPEVARMFEIALSYPEISAALNRTSATVKVIARRGGVQTKSFSHTNILLSRRQKFATEASKTGYLPEAGDTIAMQVRDPKTGHKFIIITLGEPRRSPRFSIAKRLAVQSVQSQRIAGAK